MKSPHQTLKSYHVDSLNIQIYGSKKFLGEAAADLTSEKLKKAIAERGEANLILATGASQFEFLEVLQKDPSINWSKITVFHLDEYLGMPETHPASFRKYLKERIIDKVQPKKTYFLEGDAENIEEILSGYESLLKDHPVDIACIGIGENGHIAFNDPPVADFKDPKLVKIVELDEPCRRQQLGEGWFNSIAEVPTHALSLTIPAIMRAKSISCVVPDKRKASAVYETLNGPVSVKCPASILRYHENAWLFLDKESASLVEKDLKPTF
jgi:glucosamine-6-phosphate deaminase